MKSFKIYTENKNYETVIRPLLEGYFDGFSVYRGEGNWQGKREKSLLIEVFTDNMALIHGIARRIKTANQQNAVLIAETECVVDLW